MDAGIPPGGDGPSDENEKAPDTIDVITRARPGAVPGLPAERFAELQRTIEAHLTRGKRKGRPPIHYQRVATARRRILRVLDRRTVVYFRELERQVCEVGFNFATTPPSERPEPVHFGEALNDLLSPEPAEEGDPVEPFVKQASIVVAPGHRARFLIDAWATRDEVREALDRKIAAVAAYLYVESMPPKSGWHAEDMHHRAMLASGEWWSVGWKGGSEIVRLNAKAVTVGSVDLAGGHYGSHVPVAVEVKNRREWFYETDEVIWALLGAAAELEAVPVLITRRVPENVFRLMKLIGGVAYPVTKLILPPDTADIEAPNGWTFGQATTELGFHSDIDYIDTDRALPRHRALWDSVLPKGLERRYERFMKLRGDVLRVALTERMRQRGQPKSGRPRRVVLSEFMERVYEIAAEDLAGDDPPATKPAKKGRGRPRKVSDS